MLDREVEFVCEIPPGSRITEYRGQIIVCTPGEPVRFVDFENRKLTAYLLPPDDKPAESLPPD